MNVKFLVQRMKERGYWIERPTCSKADIIRLSARVGIHPESLRLIMSGRRNPSKLALHSLAQALDCQVSDLMGKGGATPAA